MVELVCNRCGRRGRLRKDRLISKHGSDASLPDLRTRIARCERQGSMIDSYEPTTSSEGGWPAM